MKSFLKMKIDMGMLKLELAGEDAQRCLTEINRVFDKILKLQENEAIDYRLESMLSDEMLLDAKIAKMISSCSQIYHNYRANRISMENKKIIELDHGRVQDQLDMEDIRKSVQKLLFPIDKKDVKRLILHVKSTVRKAEAKKIIDMISQELPGAEIHPVYTKSNISSHTIIEGVFFGDFEEEED